MISKYYLLPTIEQKCLLKHWICQYLDPYEKCVYTNTNVLHEEYKLYIRNHTFYTIPILPNYKITRLGEMVNVLTDKFVNWKLYKLGYIGCSLGYQHRLLASAFLIPPILDVTKLQVNHKNGIKCQNNIDNLEWVTQQQNCIHAYRTGLRSDNTPIRIISAITGDEQVVYSMAEAGRILGGVSAGAIHWQLNYRRSNAPYKKHYLKYYDNRKTPKDKGISRCSRTGHLLYHDSKNTITHFLYDPCSSDTAMKIPLIAGTS